MRGGGHFYWQLLAGEAVPWTGEGYPRGRRTTSVVPSSGFSTADVDVAWAKLWISLSSPCGISLLADWLKNRHI
jgi:hypothetical protein